MQEILQLTILNHDENISKDARKEYKKTHRFSGQLEIGLDESNDELYGLTWNQDIKRFSICHLCNINKLIH